ncbi:hypothetical protein ES705_06020 [subsurface metagenome]
MKIKNISDIHKYKTLEKKLSKYKLWGNLIPENTFNINLRTILSKEEWYILEKAVYKKANYKCYICGATTTKLEIYEEWLYDYNTLKQQLNEINALCDLCYLNKHLEKKLDTEKSILHWSIVNNEDCNNFEKYEKLVRECRDLRNRFDWKVVDHLGNDITKGVKLYNLLKLVAKDYKGGYIPNSQNKEIHFKSLEDICDQFEKKISELKEIKIYKWNKDCWKCHKETPHVSYCLVFQGVVLGCIGDIEKLDEILLKEYSFVKKVFSKTQGRKVIGNTCVHCGAYQGNYFIFDEFLHYVIEEDLDKTIPNILNDNDMPSIISWLTEFEDNDEIDYNNLNNIDFLYDLGEDYWFNKRSYEYAIKIYNRILQLEPKETNALTYIGEIYTEKLEYDKAIEIFKDSIEKDYDISISDTYLLQLLIGQGLVSKHYDIRGQGYREDRNYLNVEDTTGIYEIKIAEMDCDLEKEGFEALAYIFSLKNLIIEVLKSENIEVYTHYHVLLDVFELIPEEFIAEGSYIPLEKAITEDENLCPLRIFCVKDSLHYIIEVKKYSGNEYDYTWG